MSTVELFTPDSNFWELNQQFKIANPFKKIYEKDKSKNKKESSLLMWFVAHCYDLESKFYKLPIEEKHKVIGEDFCRDVNFYDDNKDLLDDLVNAFINLSDTPVQRAMRTLNKKLEERARLIDETEYTFDYYEEDERGKMVLKRGTATQLDKMIIETKKMIEYFSDIQKELASEESQGVGKGGQVSSLND